MGDTYFFLFYLFVQMHHQDLFTDPTSGNTYKETLLLSEEQNQLAE